MYAICMYVCMYIYICVCKYACTYAYTYNKTMYSGASSLWLRNIARTRGWSVRYNIIAAAAAGDAIFLICIYTHTVYTYYNIRYYCILQRAVFGGKNPISTCGVAEVHMYLASVLICVVDRQLYTV